MRHTACLIVLPVLIAISSVTSYYVLENPSNTQPKVYPLEGRLIISGQPVGNARIAFHPLDRSTSLALCPVCITNPDGTFRLTTYSTNDGAPAGNYAVTVFWPNEAIQVDECDCPDPATHDHLCGAYTNAEKSPLRVTVRPELNTISLEVDVAPKGWNLPRPGMAEKKNRPTDEAKQRVSSRRE